jgi:aminocarboxymuconate-semialdehyde decarboxylase
MLEDAVIDVHAHYLPADALDLMRSGRAVVSTREVDATVGCIDLNGMLVGATTDQLGDVDSMLRAMDAASIDVRVISPPPFTYRYWAPPKETLALHRRLNEATTAVVARHPDRFVGLATAPLQDPDAAVAELERAADELGLSGLTVGTVVDGGNLADDGPFTALAALAARGLPLLIHPDFVPTPRIADHYLVNLVGMPNETAIALANLLLSGRLEATPGLRVCVVHGGGSFPFLLGRLEKGWAVRPETRSATTGPPGQGLRQVWFDSLTHSPSALRHLLDVVGRERVVIGSDAPFDVEEPQPLRRLRECPDLTTEEEDAVARTSPLGWLGGGRP